MGDLDGETQQKWEKQQSLGQYWALNTKLSPEAVDEVTDLWDSGTCLHQ